MKEKQKTNYRSTHATEIKRSDVIITSGISVLAPRARKGNANVIGGRRCVSGGTSAAAGPVSTSDEDFLRLAIKAVPRSAGEGSVPPPRSHDHDRRRPASDAGVLENYQNSSRVGCVLPLSLFYSDASADGVEERRVTSRTLSRSCLSIACSALSLARSTRAERDNESCFFWITPEECAVFAQEPRPPFVIPRISHHRTRALRPHQPFNYAQESPHELRGAKPRQYGLREWSPQMQRPCGPGGSPVFPPPSKRLGGSTENLIAAARRPSHLPLPASSSDSIDVDLRERSVVGNRNRKSRSVMVAAKERLRSPIPAPRMLLRPEVVETPVHEGPVKRTKFAESGKKVRKHWTDCYMILTQTALKCYKDQKTYEATKSPKPAGTPPSPTAPRAEIELPLKNGHIMPCNHQHTSRFARSLILTVGYNQYLIQDETKDGAKKWLELIQDTIFELGPSTKPAEYSPYQSSNTDLESLGRTPPAVRNPSRMKQKAGGSSNEDLPDTTEASYVRSRLKKFFAKRTALEVLVDKGIYKDEQAFGNSLERVCPSTAPRVPKFVVRCIEEIEKSEENMCTDGLYRASGNLSQVQKIRLEIDQNNWSVIENNPDIHVLTGSLKLFFRELKEPLIPCKFFDRVLAACSIKPREARTKEFREIVRALPACNRDTLKYLLEHLLRVTTYSEKNRMHTANLAIVFGPTLLWAPAEQAHNIALDCIQQNNVVDILLTDFKDIFAEDTGKNKKLA